MSKGADYAWARPDPAALKAAGVTFVVRYVSHDLSKLRGLPAERATGMGGERSRRAFTMAAGAPRQTTSGEVAALLAAGIGVALVWEDTADAAVQGHARGVSDATEANRQATALGLAGIPVYFAVDYDAAAGDQPQINAYLDGAASVIGRGRVGVYGGFWPVSRARSAGKATWYWGSYAWSGSNWGSCGWTPHLMQQLALVTICGVQCDIDIAAVADFGQAPRPGVGGDATVSQGDTGAGVSKAQTRLNVHHVTPVVVVDGVFGPATTTAVKGFQGGHSLVVDGSVGPLTWTELSKAPLAPGQLPAPCGFRVDRKRVALAWDPVPGDRVTGYTCVAYGVDGREYARTVTMTPQHWCVMNGLAAGGTYTFRVWPNGGDVAPAGADLTITLPT